MKKIETNNNTFEAIKHIDEFGNEYWEARELMDVLEYSKWENFKKVIDKASMACKHSNINDNVHFPEVRKLSKKGNNADMYILDYRLSRYACYLIAQNGDNRKQVIALAQTYFAIQNRKQELSEKEYDELTEEEKRFYQRNLTKRVIIRLIKLQKVLV